MAEEEFGTILTTIGKAKIANSALLGNKLVLKTLKIGDSNGEYYEPIESQTELKHEVYSCDIGSIKIDDKNPNWVKVETILSSSVGGFTIREVGICDADGDLIAISKYPESYKPIIENGAGKDICIRLILEVSNAEQITLDLDFSTIIATKEDVDNLQEQINNNTAQLKEKANDTDNSRTTTDKSVTGAINELNSRKAPINSPSFTGIVKTTSGVEIGNTTTTTPYVDFHSSSNDVDYDARIISTGGNTTQGQGNLAIWCGGLKKNNNHIVEALNNGFKIQSGQVNVNVTKANETSTLDVVFPTEFSSVLTSLTTTLLTTNTGQAGYINIGSSNKEKTGFTLNVTSYVAQTVAVQWVAIGV